MIRWLLVSKSVMVFILETPEFCVVGKVDTHGFVQTHVAHYTLATHAKKLHGLGSRDTLVCLVNNTVGPKDTRALSC